MRLRNNIFAAAFDYLKREKGIKTQKRLAELMGVSEDTITRIMKDRTEVTEDIITKLQTASGCIFNLQWLRGEDAFHMLSTDLVEEQHQNTTPVDQSSLINAMLASKDETIAEKDKRIKEKDETIALLNREVAKSEQTISDIRNSLADKEELIKMLKAKVAELDNAKQITELEDWKFPVGAADERTSKHL